MSFSASSQRAHRWVQGSPVIVTDMKTSSSIRRVFAVAGAAVFVGASALGVSAYSFLKPTTTASGPIESVTLAAPQTSATVYELESSEARFIVDEVLRGSPFTVVGTSDQVAG